MRRSLAFLASMVVCFSANAWMPRGTTFTTYTGPCDVISGGCVEAYSYTRAMTVNYSGPLFQISKNASPYTTCDVGQDTNHKASPAACIASVCTGAVISGCFYSKAYSQIHVHRCFTAQFLHLGVPVN